MDRTTPTFPSRNVNHHLEHYSEFDPIEPVEFERGDRGEAEGEFRSGRRYPMVRIFQFLR